MTTPSDATSAAVNPYAPPRAAVGDIADPAAGLELADRGARLAAAILDTIIFGIMVYAPLFMIVFAADPDLASGTGTPDPSDSVMGAGLVVALIGFAVWAWLTIRWVLQNGQSIAKKMLKIKVVRTDGSPASFSRIFWLRNVVNGLLSIIPLYGFIEVLFIFGETRRCLHDRLADTIVVKA